jgi:hypothetical protein
VTVAEAPDPRLTWTTLLAQSMRRSWTSHGVPLGDGVGDGDALARLDVPPGRPLGEWTATVTP